MKRGLPLLLVPRTTRINRVPGKGLSGASPAVKVETGGVGALTMVELAVGFSGALTIEPGLPIGKPVSSHFPAGFQPRRTRVNLW
jgi:hypothetical protein